MTDIPDHANNLNIVQLRAEIQNVLANWVLPGKDCPRQRLIHDCHTRSSVSVGVTEKEIPLANLRTMDEVVAESVQSRRFVMQLLSIFAVIAMLLAASGLYGVMSYSTAQRTREIGIRMALGAHKRDMVKLVVSQGMTLAFVGIVVGGVASVGLTRMISGLLYGVDATDLYVFAAVAGLLATVALVANYRPARRAANIDPMVALRYE